VIFVVARLMFAAVGTAFAAVRTAAARDADRSRGHERETMA
jgi:hypothetical protein